MQIVRVLQKCGQYTTESVYLVARNILKYESEVEFSEFNITKFQAFFWKIKVPLKVCYLIWQPVTWHVAVTKNLTHRIRYDNNYFRCWEPDASIILLFLNSPLPKPYTHGSHREFFQFEYLHQYELTLLAEQYWKSRAR